jgi:hypothetical protein
MQNRSEQTSPCALATAQREGSFGRCLYFAGDATLVALLSAADDDADDGAHIPRLFLRLFPQTISQPCSVFCFTI